MQGKCLCGGVVFEVTSEPLVVNNCHCSQCRRYTGAAFATWVHVPRESFSFRQGADLVREYETAGGGIWAFCCQCGSPVPHIVPGSSSVQLPAGVVDDEMEIAPALHQFVESKAAWFQITDHLPQFEGKVPFERRLALWGARRR